MTTEDAAANERRSAGLAGPSREVSKRDQIPSGAGGAGRKNDGKAQDLKEAGVQPVRSVFRKTKLHGELPQVITRQIRERGDTLYRISVKRTHWHHYNLTVRTKTIPKELAPGRSTGLSGSARLQASGAEPDHALEVVR